MDEGLDLSKLPNPYDFSHPVSNPEMFSGREKQLDEIRYYLDQALIAPRPFNIALLGPRAAGKTSLLNRIEWEARNRGMLVARLALNEDDVRNELQFFWKLFDAVFSSACKFARTLEDGELAECFGGRSGATYQAYDNMVTLGELPATSEWIPFNFPVLYAKAVTSGRKDIPLSEPRFIEDLTLIAREVSKPIVILFDECNVLGESRVLLQRIRNIFMNMSGYMLVLTGTPDLFPVMDEVFSPIARDFKRIGVDAFETEAEARDCVIRPLLQIGIKDATRLIDSETYRDLVSSQGLTGQKPYEIQLLCHFLFRQLQRTKARTMKLDLEVLDDVLRELSRGSGFSSRPIIDSVRLLDSQELRSLSWLCRTSGRLPFDRLWLIEQVIHGTSRHQNYELQQHLQSFINKGILTVRDEKVTFQGDEFDRIYLKYYARTKGERLIIESYPGELLYRIELTARFNELLERPFFFMAPLSASDANGSDVETFVRDVLSQFDLSEFKDKKRWQYNTFVDSLYQSMFEANRHSKEVIEAIAFTISTEWMRERHVFFVENDALRANIVKDMEEIKDRAEELGAVAQVHTFEVDVIANDKLIASVKSLSDRSHFVTVTSWHRWNLVDAYVEKHDADTAILHFDALLAFGAEQASLLNNGGYIHLAAGDYMRATQHLTRALELSDGLEDAALPNYNLGCCELMNGNALESVRYFGQAARLAGRLGAEDQIMTCLFVPVLEGGNICLTEVEDPNLLDCARAAEELVVATLAG